jgi:integrase
MSRPRGQSLGGRYRSQPRDPTTGRRLNISGRTLSELESRLSRVSHVRDGLKYGDISAVEAQGKLRPAVGMRLEVRALVARFIAGVPPGSVRPANGAWRNLLAPWFGEKVVWDLTNAALRAWKSDLERIRRPGGRRGYAPKYVRYAWDLLTGSVRLAMRDGLLSELPWGDFYVPNPKRPQKERETARDPGEMLRLLMAARAWDENEGRKTAFRFPILLVLMLTGLRQAEAAGLDWTDVDFERGVLRIRRQAVRGWPRLEGGDRPQALPKGGRTREQAMHPDVERTFRYQRHVLRTLGFFADDGPVFPRPGSPRWRTSGGVMKPAAFRKIVERAGLPNVAAWTVHSTRHSFSRLELIGHGGDLTTVAGRTGHADLETLQGYLQKPARDVGGSKIPELPPGLGVPALEVGAGPGAIVLAGSEEPDAMPTEKSEIATYETPSWTELARAWVGRGEPLRRPAAVSAQIKAAYSRAYNEGLRATRGDKAAAREQAFLAKRGALGAWAKAVKAARKEKA